MAHLGSGSSLTAMHRGAPVDTTMAFTPTSGVMVGTRARRSRSWPACVSFAIRELASRTDGRLRQPPLRLLGVSGITSDMRELMKRRTTDANAADAIELFCYQVKKCIGSFATVLGGMETLVFSGGIGEHSPETRAGICTGMEFLGIDLDPERNQTFTSDLWACVKGDGAGDPDGRRVNVAKIVLDLIAGQPDRKV